jgi:pimeloyl-ACP methyl ester carboxylesterase
MLIWINGAHGAGKTSVARRLAAIRPATVLVDPEEVGFMLRRTWPGRGPADFKELPAWRDLTLALLSHVAADDPARTLVVPMTLAEPVLFKELTEALRQAGVDLRHFTLLASPATLRRRIRWRLDWPASRKWALAQVEACVAALNDQAFAEHLATEGRTVTGIADDILERVGQIS